MKVQNMKEHCHFDGVFACLCHLVINSLLEDCFHMNLSLNAHSLLLGQGENEDFRQASSHNESIVVR